MCQAMRLGHSAWSSSLWTSRGSRTMTSPIRHRLCRRGGTWQTGPSSWRSRGHPPSVAASSPTTHRASTDCKDAPIWLSFGIFASPQIIAGEDLGETSSIQRRNGRNLGTAPKCRSKPRISMSKLAVSIRAQAAYCSESPVMHMMHALANTS